MVLLIDNYDSFTYNVAHCLEELGASVEVVLNDRIRVEEIAARHPGALVLSPGPGTPDGAGITLDAISAFSGKIPILGICLGHQAIGQAFGGKVVQAPTLMHGKPSQVHHDGRGVFAHLPSPLSAVRYHSLTLDPDAFPAQLR
ncbi:MAG TPA: aminodeoxychorismate/anthranilate synthase component II, partial [Sphingomonadales bacterium]|nr:aminodeoxychorismate/anthranilate synthase component II [Sphingomonadales bacterium]